ncbi:FAD-dependent oxidoreductase [Actinomadura oligospora]|uniref:FAD-dependent oxidoreductase n=1 Tax=Actinomadura oligospora TaxID=111804 RepID=UPI0004B42602|nr:FAD-dependent oxidoreductase [Actinomadura oligospora]
MGSDIRRAIVVGAGIAGLTTALRLRGIGWDVLLLERAPARRRGGYALTLTGGGHAAAEALGILPGLRERHFDVDLLFVNADGGRRFTLPADRAEALRGGRALNLLRGDIEDVLFTAVPDDVEVRFGATVTSIAQDEDGVRAVLDDGTTERADLLVGADGLHSAVRDLAFDVGPSVLRDLGYTVAAFSLRKLPAGLAERAVTTFSPPGRSIAVASLGRDRAAAYFIHKSSDPAGDRALGPEQTLANRYGDLGWVVPDLLGQLADTDSVYFDGVAQIAADRWHRGRVVLVGDAAWCLTPFSGYGASLSMAGADLLGTALEAEPADIPAALTAWEARLRPEADRFQTRARRAAAMHAPSTRSELLRRDFLLRAASLRPVTHVLAHLSRH